MIISINISNESVLDMFNRLLDAMDDPTQALAAVGMQMESNISGRFEAQIDPTGAPWVPWTESTRKSYPKDGHGRLLNRSGGMLDSLNHQVNGNTVSWGVAAKSTNKHGVDFLYPEAHEFGTSKMERRGIFFADPDTGMLGPEDEKTILDQFNDFIQRAIEG